MASIIKVGEKWRAQIRRKGHKPITETFPTRASAKVWATKTEASMDAGKYSDKRGLADTTLTELIKKYRKEMGDFGKNKTAVIASLDANLGALTLDQLTATRLTTFVQARRKAGAGGVTIGIDLTYLGGLLRAAKVLWGMPVNLEAITDTREKMRHLKISTHSRERTRRPTGDELSRLCDYFDKHSKLPMRDIIGFAVATAMRASEITGLRWADLNEQDRTITIRDRKHPQEKLGNDQEVPLLGEAFAIVKRQPVGDLVFPVDAKSISTIFPRASKALGIVDLRFHDLRHEGVSRLFEQGYRIEQVALVSGHRDWKMLKRYTQLRAVDLHRRAPADTRNDANLQHPKTP